MEPYKKHPTLKKVLTEEFLKEAEKHRTNTAEIQKWRKEELGTINSKIGPVFKVNEILSEIFGELTSSKQFDL